MNGWLIVAFLVSLFAIAYALFQYIAILKKSPGNEKMQELSGIIHKGSMTFLKKEYMVLAAFMVVAAVALNFLISRAAAVTFVAGTFFSILSGFIGMACATRSNARTAEAARKSIGDGLKVAFGSGMVMGMATTGLGLLGIIIVYLVYKDPNLLFGFGLGASSSALFARVAGGIYTKAADVGADLVGKVEKGIPEDDPRNPAVIADNVGDNVGGVAGMGADLFESYVEALIASMVVGVVAFGEKGLMLPFAIFSIGIIAAALGSLFVRIKGNKIFMAIDKGTYASAAFTLIGVFLIIRYYMGAENMGLFYATVAGLITGVLLGYAVEYTTSPEKKPTQSIAEAAKTGAGTVIIRGMAVAMQSTFWPMVAISLAMILAYYFGGLYGITIAAVGMLSIVTMSLAADAYGPVVDNAAGISEMAKLEPIVRKRTELLDAAGNTTAAASRGLQLGASALTVLALYASFLQITKVEVINLTSPYVIAGIFVGGAIPFLFSSILIKAVGKAAFDMVIEIRRQWKSNKKIMLGTVKPDYGKCIGISTNRALKEMTVPGLLAIVIPIAIGRLMGLDALAGLLMGTIVSGVLLSMFMSNAGSAWDNAKKYIEEGHFGGKGSEAHKASVVGDTVGDPLKDTAGPSLDILIKLVTIAALVFIPFFM